VSRITRGKRYAFLPFLYDDAAAKIREANNKFLGEGVGAYRTGEKSRKRPPRRTEPRRSRFGAAAGAKERPCLTRKLMLLAYC
jgi:hypothetical protein